MTITIDLRPEDEQRLRDRAQEIGRDLPEYVQQILEEHLRAQPRPEVSPSTFDQVMAPIWEGWRQSGMTEEQIDAMFRRELEQLRNDRMERRGLE